MTRPEFFTEFFRGLYTRVMPTNVAALVHAADVNSTFCGRQ
jgi:hypothetical protein